MIELERQPLDPCTPIGKVMTVLVVGRAGYGREGRLRDLPVEEVVVSGIRQTVAKHDKTMGRTPGERWNANQ